MPCNNCNIKGFMNFFCSDNLIKKPTYFKWVSLPCINLIITNQNKPFYEIIHISQWLIRLSLGSNNDSKENNMYKESQNIIL